MNCLHICNDLLGSKVHENLYKKLGELKITQTIYYPSRAHTVTKLGKLDKSLLESIKSSKKLNFSHRLFFRKKINFLFNDLQKKVELKNYEIVHATTLFSDGALALKIFKKYGIPYIVALRGTDVNLFIKYRYDLYPLGKEIVKNAKKIVFISDSLEKNYSKSIFAKYMFTNRTEKCVVIPNGIDPFWLQNIAKTKLNHTPTKFLYIGKFNYNKNILRLVQAFLNITKKHSNTTLTFVGSGGNQEKEIIKLVEKHPTKIKFQGPVYDKDELLEVYQNHDIFAMASISETFGLVYMEALSQGLPLLYTKEQGIDGTFNKKIGVAVNPKSTKSIENGLELLINQYSEMEIEQLEFSKFSWDEIANRYIQLYTEIKNEMGIPTKQMK